VTGLGDTNYLNPRVNVNRHENVTGVRKEQALVCYIFITSQVIRAEDSEWRWANLRPDLG